MDMDTRGVITRSASQTALKLPAELAHTMPAPNVPTPNVLAPNVPAHNVAAPIATAQTMTAPVRAAPNVTATQIPYIAALMIKFMQDQPLAADKRAEEHARLLRKDLVAS